MTVVGVGIDVVDVAAFADQLSLPGSRFVAETFTAGERADVPDGDQDRLAARYAAKEAFIKAWSGSRFGSAPTMSSWELRDVEVVTDLHGRPAVRARGAVADALDEQLGPDWRAHLSLSHDGPVAAAVVVLAAAGATTSGEG